MQRQYQRARAVVNERLKVAIRGRADRHNEDRYLLDTDRGSRVWLYLDRVKEGYARKLAHMWHGPFRVAEKCGDHAVKLDIAGTPYRLFPIFHVSKLKLVRIFPERPTGGLNADEAIRPSKSLAVKELTTQAWKRRSRVGCDRTTKLVPPTLGSVIDRQSSDQVGYVGPPHG
uniref:Tf2-1-like SH3-like domain-containing protein n=1 Tax=Hyaloperonospora arabidopsidis (strain Emoy2) TaxID=559515 RepID=M4C564_HYAAE